MTKIDWKRYRKVRLFFAKTLLHVIWWDIIVNRSAEPALGILGFCLPPLSEERSA
jgi:hypothetical protein